MRYVLISALAIIAASFATPIHPPPRVNHLIVRNSSCPTKYNSDPNLTGGSGGTFFAGPSLSDIAALSKQPGLPNITTISISGGERVDKISYGIVFPNGSVNTYTYGGTGGNLETLHLEGGEVINKVQVQLGGRISRRSITGEIPSANPDEGSGVIPGEGVGAIPGEGSGDITSETLDRGHGEISETSEIPDGNPIPDALDTSQFVPFDIFDKMEKHYAGMDEYYNELEDHYQKVSLKLSALKLSPTKLVVGGSIIFIAGAAVGAGGFVGGLEIKHRIEKNRHDSLRLYCMSITTSLGRSLQQGTPDDRPVMTFTPPAGYTKLVGFVGRSGNEVDAITPIWG